VGVAGRVENVGITGEVIGCGVRQLNQWLSNMSQPAKTAYVKWL